MAVDPATIHAISIALVESYRDAELRLIELIGTYLRQGIDAPTWAVERLNAVTRLRRAAGDILGQLEVDNSAAVREYVAQAYRTGYGSALTDIPEPVQDAILARVASRTVTRTGAMEALAGALVQDIGVRHANVLRHVIDVYRATIAQATALSITGGVTRLRASQDAFARFIDQGVSTFTDGRGRTWRMSSYVEMAVRTVTQRAAVQGQTDRLQTVGIDLVVVSDSPRECPKCRPWEGKILAISGPTGRIQVESVVTGEPITVDVAGTVDDARRGGLQHPNCTHSLRSYLPGATRVREAKANPDGFEAQERQREIERSIRRWKEREAGALDPDAQRAASRKVRGWQQTMREHLAANPELKRLSYREQIGAGNQPPRGLRGGSEGPSPVVLPRGGPSGPSRGTPGRPGTPAQRPLPGMRAQPGVRPQPGRRAQPGMPGSPARSGRPTPTAVQTALRKYGDWERDPAILTRLPKTELRNVARYYGLKPGGSPIQLRDRIRAHLRGDDNLLRGEDTPAPKPTKRPAKKATKAKAPAKAPAKKATKAEPMKATKKATKAPPPAPQGEAAVHGNVGPQAARLRSETVAAQSINEAARGTNPRYARAYEGPITDEATSVGVGYTQNCTRCAISYEMRRRGLDVTAGAGLSTGDITAAYVHTFRDAGRYATRIVDDLARSMSARDIAREVETWPLGGRGIVVMRGHTLNVERDALTGKARFIDTQAARDKAPVMDLAGFSRRAKARGAPTDRWMSVARVDDLDLSDYGLRYVEGPDLRLVDGQIGRTEFPQNPDSEYLSTTEEIAALVPDDTYP